MRRLLLFVLLCACAHAWSAPYTVESVPNQRLVDGSHVSNPDGVLDANSALSIDQLLIALEQRTGTQVAVVAVESIDTTDEVAFAQQLFERWKIGGAGRDDGLLVLLVKDQRVVRMHTGYGLEGVLPDVVCVRIQREVMVPAFKEGLYGEGMLAGMRTVATILIEPAHAQAFLTAPAEEDQAPISRIRAVPVAIAYATFLLFAFVLKAAFGHFSRKMALERGIRTALRWKASVWFIVFIVVPVVFILALPLVDAPARDITAVLGLYGYFLLVTLVQAWRQRTAIARLLDQGEYVAIDTLLRDLRSFWLVMALLFPLPFALYVVFQLTARKRYRNRPRACRLCKAPMRKLGETEEDAHLSKAQQTEEVLGALDYDLWRCDACGALDRYVYDGAETAYTPCPKCNSRTYVKESDRVLVKATTEQAGEGETEHRCRYCGHHETKRYAIPKIVVSTSSGSSSSGFSSGSGSSSSGSSSSGSSWGGGSSGGGGASSRW